MKILLYGGSGMLGSAIVAEATNREHQGWKGAYGFGMKRFQHDVSFDDALVRADINDQQPDVIINAAGIIPENRFSDAGMVYMNAVLPHIIAERAAETGVPFIHVSTDCTGEPTLYGRSKLAGEPESAIVIRTSFVGPQHGLWAWLVAEAAAKQEIHGWARVMWSGSTVWAVATAIIDIAGEARRMHPAALNLATIDPISKLEVLDGIDDALDLNADLAASQEERDDSRVMLPNIALEPFAAALATARERGLI